MIYHRAGLYTPPGPTISSASRVSLGGALSAMASLSSVVAWPLANVALFVPLMLDTPFTVRSVWWLSNTGTGNIDIALYDPAGVRLTSLGSTAKTTAMAQANLAAAYTLQPGLYYMAFAHDGTSNFVGSASSAGIYEALGVCEQTSAFVLPNPATMVRTTRAAMPLFGLSSDTIVL